MRMPPPEHHEWHRLGRWHPYATPDATSPNDAQMMESFESRIVSLTPQPLSNVVQKTILIKRTLLVLLSTQITNTIDRRRKALFSQPLPSFLRDRI